MECGKRRWSAEEEDGKQKKKTGTSKANVEEVEGANMENLNDIYASHLLTPT